MSGLPEWDFAGVTEIMESLGWEGDWVAICESSSVGRAICAARSETTTARSTGNTVAAPTA